MSFLADLMDSVLTRGRSLMGLPQPDAPPEDPVALCRALLSSRGEASGVALAEAALAAYRRLGPEERTGFLGTLVSDFGADRQAVEAAVLHWQNTPDEEALARLHQASEPRRQELLRRLNHAASGTLQLVRMREDVLRRIGTSPHLAALDRDFLHLFTSWFNRGFLVLRPVGWGTPANILEKIIRYEAVHAIESWQDLRRRLEPADRRCFAFFHPQMVDEPLVFVEVALTDQIPGTIAEVLREDRQPIDPAAATTAVFYSISNCQDGLRGVSFGNFLIKQVVAELRRDLPGLENFVTLSPVPGFAGWLEQECARPDGLLDDGLKQRLAPLARPGWTATPDPALDEALEESACLYFLTARHRDRVIDPVARFHLGNGARLEQINLLGDPSAKGLKQAHGLMVNYRYVLAEIEKNHEAFVNEQKVTVAPALLKRHQQFEKARKARQKAAEQA
jgi:malonyl-CoA decarboxylase